MKNRLITVAFVAFVMGSTIQLVSALIFAATVPCSKSSDCLKNLSKNAYCESGVCMCPGVVEHPKHCEIEDFKNISAETPPLTSSTAEKSSSTQIPPKTSTGSTVVTNPTTLNPSTVSSTTETTPEPIINSTSRSVAKDLGRCPTPCPTPFGFCNTTKKQCDCEEGYVMAVNNTKCLAVVFGLGSNCTENEQCQKRMGNTTCEDEQCVCEEGYHETGFNECWKTIKLGEKCSDHKECSDVSGAVCDETGICKCLAGTMANKNKDKCLPVAHNYFDSCEEKSQCLAKMPNSICTDEKCQCENNHHFNETQFACVFYPSLGQNCQKNYECDQGEEQGATRFQLCDDKICTCREPFYENGDFCTDGAASLVSGFLSLLAAIFLFSRG